MKAKKFALLAVMLLLFLSGCGRQVRFGDRWVDADGLSEETLDWLDWYNALPEEQQRAVSSLPPDLLEQSGLAQTEDAEAEDS
ncbi:MAG TPA: hypothetical protein H9999_08360 [Candidatus Negativibacillus faecipullorum]|nr:hypothetical protein [Candidatus Negativibacillus faecipullorum]